MPSINISMYLTEEEYATYKTEKKECNKLAREAVFSKLR